MAERGGALDVSIVVPCYNEQDNVAPLYEDLREVLERLEVSFEVVFVDDGSRDSTFAVLASLHRGDERVRVVRLRRNFGQTSALMAGFDYARGQIIIAMDGDRQYRPSDIPKLLAKVREGFDIASGWRANRRDALFTRRLPSRVANRLMALVSGVRLRDFGSTFKAYRRDIAKEIRLYGEMHRFVPALASAVGANIAEVPIEVLPRSAGKSKYGLGRTWRVLLDIISVKFLISYSKQPLRLFGLIGLLLGGIGVAIGLSLGILKLFFGEPLGMHQPLLLMAVALTLIGVQFVSLGLVAELVCRTYHESQGKPIYHVRETLGDADAERRMQNAG